jgi:cobalamin biosynthesis protein CobD/CbiB
LVLGLPGLFLQQAADVMTAALGPKAGEFGRAPASLARALSAPPRYLAGLVLAAAAVFVPGGRPRAVLGAAFAARTGPAEVLAGGAGGGPARARIERGLAVLVVACLIDAGLVALVALVRLAL